jgi:hypothetical protein
MLATPTFYAQTLYLFSSGALAALSDIISQLIVQVGKSGNWHYSWRSTVAFSAFRY